MFARLSVAVAAAILIAGSAGADDPAPLKKGDQVAIRRIVSDESTATNEIPLYAGDDIGQCRAHFGVGGGRNAETRR